MTEMEAVEFVDTEIAERYKNLSDAVRGDWLRAVKRCDVGVARAIVREIVDDATTRLCVKEFIKRRPRERKPQIEIPHYFPWVRCLEAPAEHPDWQNQEWLRFDSWRPSDAADKEAVVTMASLAAQEIQQQYGGEWCGVVRPDGQRPENHPELWGAEAERWVREHILNGPDSGDRRFLEGESRSLPGLRSLQAKVVGSLQKKTAGLFAERKLPSQAELEALTEKPEGSETGGPRAINWDDEDLPWEQG